MPRLQKGLRTQAAVDAEDLATADLKNLIITVNGRAVAADTVVIGRPTWDATGRISVPLTLQLPDIPVPWRVQVATKTQSLVLISHQPQRRDWQGETHVLSVQSTAHALLGDRLKSQGKEAATVPPQAIELLAQRLETAFAATSSSNPLETSSVVDAAQKLANAIGNGTPDGHLRPVLETPSGGGGGGGGGGAPHLPNPILNPAPIITTVTPNHGSTSMPTPIVITGTGFVDGCTVNVGGQAATSVKWISSTEIQATVPAGLPVGWKGLSVIHPSHFPSMSLLGFTVDPAGIDTVTTVKDGQKFVGTPVGGEVL